MRGHAKLWAIAAVLAAVQIASPLAGAGPVAGGQIDPCEPVPIPELCPDEPPPLPTPNPEPDPDPSPSPSPKPSPKPDDPKDGGGKQQDDDPADGKPGGGGPRGGKGDDATDTPEPQPFFLGGPQNTSRVIKIVSQLEPYGISQQQAMLEVAGPFPIAGLAWWTDDWHACRDGCTRFHLGLDIFAEMGTPLVATADGVVTQKLVGDLSGISLEIEDASGIQYFYAHLSAYEEPINVGDQVTMGQVIGYVGNTGNAIYTPPHVHFEFQPGGVPAPPKPWVDQWLEIAERRALQLVLEITGEPPVTVEQLDTFRLTRSFDLAGAAGAADATSAQLLLLAGLQPAASSLEMARRTLDRMAWEIDWGDQVDAQLASLILEYEQVQAQQAVMATPFLSPLPEVNLGDVHVHEAGD